MIFEYSTYDHIVTRNTPKRQERAVNKTVRHYKVPPTTKLGEAEYF